MPSSPPVAAIIDIGSNSIKVLVATRSPAGQLQVVMTRTMDARISAGISRNDPRLSSEGMARGLEAVRALLAAAAAFAPSHLRLVATSAVRDARNGAEFRDLIRRETGHAIRILTGAEEANLIGRGLTCDPALADLRHFYVFDLGGGSLECLAFRERTIEQALSLPLGCVRLTERFVADTSGPLDAAALETIRAHTRAALQASTFRFDLPDGAAAVATGGTATTARAIFAARLGAPFETTAPTIAVTELAGLLGTLAAMPLDRRKQVAGLPPPRADVFPCALATMLALAEVGGLREFRNSLYNLRYGLADEALA
jgi:exopolyphosphatase/guanosine-5'-triphosphate,3'-diphosphate pyrophosphatase